MPQHSITNPNIAMDMQPPGVATIAGDAEVDHLIATLVLAFGTDPVARWMYDDPHQYLLHIPRLFRALGTSSFEAGAAQRTNDGFGVALWLPPGVHGDDGPLEAVIAESIVGEKQVEVAAVFEQTEHYRPKEPHWYLSLIGIEALHQSKGRGAALLEHRLRQCDRQHLPEYLWSSNPLTTSLYQRHGFDIAGTIRVGSSPSIYPMLRSGTAKPAHASTSHSFAERTSSEKCHARPADDAGYLAAAHLCRICAERCRRSARDNDRKPPCAPYRVWGRAGRSSGRA